MVIYFGKAGNTGHILKKKFKGLSNVVIKPCTTANNSLASKLSYIGNKITVKFNGSCLKQG